MADNNSVGGVKSKVDPITLSEAQQPSSGTKPKEALKTEDLGAQEFLTLLVNQLQHQDPLNPMNSEEFAVQLAQFSQLEKLISIDDKLGGGLNGSNPIGSMASYLGHEVVIKDGLMNVQGGKGSNLLLDIPEGTQSIRVDFTDAEGKVVGQTTMEDIQAGRQVVHLNGLSVKDGVYDVRVVSVDASGKFVDLPAKVTGTVEGFVLEPEPSLLVGGEEVALEDVLEVHVGKA